MIIGFGAVIVIDSLGLLWILKKIKLQFVQDVAGLTQRLIWLGWSGLVLSGTGLLVLKGFIDNLTAIKIFFVAMLGLNGLFLHTIKKSFECVTDETNIPAILKFRMTLASAISQMGWWGALIIGFTHRQISSFIPWPASPWPYIIGIFLGISVIALVGEMLLRPKTKNVIETSQ